MRVYIAGAVESHPAPELVRENIKQWESESVEWIDPLDYESEEDDPEEIIEGDIKLVEHCQALLVYWNPEFSSWGTPSELYHASEIAEIPTVVWQTEDGEKRPTWLKGLADEIFERPEEVVDWIDQLAIQKV